MSIAGVHYDEHKSHLESHIHIHIYLRNSYTYLHMWHQSSSESFFYHNGAKFFMKYSLNAFKWQKSNIKYLSMKSSEIVFIFLSAFYLIMWLMTSPKNFEKMSILKIWQLDFFWGVKIYLGKFLPKWYIFRHWKIWFSQIMPFDSYYFHLM